MSDPYERVKGGRLTFKGGSLATRSKSIDKKKKITKNKNKNPSGDYEVDPSDLEHLPQAKDFSDTVDGGVGGGEGGGGGEPYTIDAAKKMKYEELFPVETKKFGYQPKKDFKSVEEALDDRVKKKADRYCK